MRPAMLATALLLLLAGCAEEPAVQAPLDEQPAPAGDEPRTARGGTDGTGAAQDAEDRIEQTILSAPIQMLGGISSASFEVDVPADAGEVRVRITSDPTVSAGQLSIALDGCGGHGDGTISVGSGAGGIDAVLCDKPESGKHVLTVENPGGVIDGTISVTASVPRPVQDGASDASGSSDAA